MQEVPGGVMETSGSQAPACLVQLEQMAVAEQARRLAVQGDIRGAAVILEDLVVNHKNELSPRVMDLAARVRARSGDFQGAQLLWADALALDPGNPEYAKALKRCGTALKGPSSRFGASVAWSKVITIALVFCLVGVCAFQARLYLASTNGSDIPGGTHVAPNVMLTEQVATILAEYGSLSDVTATVAEPSIVKVSGTVRSLEAKYQLEQELASIPNITAIDTSGLVPIPNVVVQAGDTLWSIAEEWLGSGHRWPLLAKANGLQAPYDIQPGDLVLLP